MEKVSWLIFCQCLIFLKIVLYATDTIACTVVRKLPVVVLFIKMPVMKVVQIPWREGVNSRGARDN